MTDEYCPCWTFRHSDRCLHLQDTADWPRYDNHEAWHAGLSDTIEATKNFNLDQLGWREQHVLSYALSAYRSGQLAGIRVSRDAIYDRSYDRS